MPATHDRSLSLVPSLPSEPLTYVINLYTSVSDPEEAAVLAIQTSEAVRNFQGIDHLSTTISIEDDVTAEPERVFVDLVR
jgi:hypothetical protein